MVSEMSWNINHLFMASRPIAIDYLIQCLIVLPVVFALCSFWFVLTEKPFMRWSLQSKPKPGPGLVPAD
jgi:hypothetical protein